MKALLDDIRQLTELPSPSGREGDVAKVIRKNWERYGEVCEDGLGNLSITVGEEEPHVAFTAHMDEVGFVIRHIRDDGFIGLNRLGGIPERVLVGQKLLLMGRQGLVTGVFTTWPHHLTPDSEKYKVRPIGECWLDVGARNREEVAQLGLRVGDFAVYARSWHVEGDSVFANSLDNRAGLASITQMLERLAGQTNCRLSAIASVQEEFSVRALVPTVRELNPDALVVVDISPATDTPEMKEHSDISLGGGPVLHLHSFHGRGTLGGVLPPAWLVDLVEKGAEVIGVPIQRASVVGVITDGAFSQHLNHGIPVIEIGFPVRYTHCPVEVCSIQDLEWLVNLLVATGNGFADAYFKRFSIDTDY